MAITWQHSDTRCEAVRMAREAEYPYRLTQALGYLARVLRYDDPVGARQAADEAVEVARRTPGTGVGNTLMTQADLAAIAGSPYQAVALVRDATVAWGDVVPGMALASAAARACRILADVDGPRPPRYSPALRAAGPTHACCSPPSTSGAATTWNALSDGCGSVSATTRSSPQWRRAPR